MQNQLYRQVIKQKWVWCNIPFFIAKSILFVWIFNRCSITGIGTEMHKKVNAEYQFTTIILQLQRKINCGIEETSSQCLGTDIIYKICFVIKIYYS